MWAVGAVVVAFALAGCVRSNEPILGDAKAILGERLQIHVFAANPDGLRDASTSSFVWDGKRYALRGRSREINDFTVHAYEGRDLIVQSKTARGERGYAYGLARKIAEGVYLVVPIDENDADEPARQRFCVMTGSASCRIETPEQLFVFARATAARDDERIPFFLAVVMPARQR